ncbi:MAG: ABC transporter ATP-binding protein [Clostridium sp.]
MEIIKLKDLTKKYGDSDGEVFALKNINLSINEGELIAIIGTSGSGKSTLLNMIGLLDKPTSGEVYINGRNIKNLKNREISVIRNEEIGFIFQSFNLIYNLSVLKNVEMPLIYSKKNKSNRFEKCKEITRKLRIEKHLHKTPDKLSGGERQRVAIARALVNEGNIILADEPTGALDKKTGNEVMEILREINAEGKTVIIVTHNENIANMCSRVVKIEDGAIVS